jgi:hypothetical protein
MFGAPSCVPVGGPGHRRRDGRGGRDSTIVIAHSEELLAIKLRAGNVGANTASDHLDVLAEAIAQVPAQHRRHLLIRILEITSQTVSPFTVSVGATGAFVFQGGCSTTTHR